MWLLGRYKGARLEIGIFERAVKPERELPTQFEGRKLNRVIAFQRMVCRVAMYANLIKNLFDFTLKQALVLQATDQQVLAFVLRHIQATTRSQRLRQGFSELPQLEKTGVGVFGKVTFGQRAQALQLGL